LGFKYNVNIEMSEMNKIGEKRGNPNPNTNANSFNNNDDYDNSDEMRLKKTKTDEQVLEDINKTVRHFFKEAPLQITAETKKEEAAIDTLMEMEGEKIYLNSVNPVSLISSTKDGKTSLVSLASSSSTKDGKTSLVSLASSSSAKDGRPSEMIASNKDRIIEQFKRTGYSVPQIIKPKNDADTIIVSNLFKGFEDKKNIPIPSSDIGLYSKLSNPEKVKLFLFSGHGSCEMAYSVDTKNKNGVNVVEMYNTTKPYPEDSKIKGNSENLFIVPPNVLYISLSPAGALAFASGNNNNAFLLYMKEQKQYLLDMIRTGRISELFKFVNITNQKVREGNCHPEIACPYDCMINIRFNIHPNDSNPRQSTWSAGLLCTDTIIQTPRGKKMLNVDSPSELRGKVHMGDGGKEIAAYPLLNLSDLTLLPDGQKKDELKKDFLGIIGGKPKVDNKGIPYWDGTGELCLKDLLETISKATPPDEFSIVIGDHCLPIKSLNINPRTFGNAVKYTINDIVAFDEAAKKKLEDEKWDTLVVEQFSKPISDLQLVRNVPMRTQMSCLTNLRTYEDRVYDVEYNPYALEIFLQYRDLCDLNYDKYTKLLRNRSISSSSSSNSISSSISSSSSSSSNSISSSISSSRNPVMTVYITAENPLTQDRNEPLVSENKQLCELFDGKPYSVVGSHNEEAEQRSFLQRIMSSSGGLFSTLMETIGPSFSSLRDYMYPSQPKGGRKTKKAKKYRKVKKYKKSAKKQKKTAKKYKKTFKKM